MQQLHTMHTLNTLPAWLGWVLPGSGPLNEAASCYTMHGKQAGWVWVIQPLWGWLGLSIILIQT
jgi:hypothetical protein